MASNYYIYYGNCAPDATAITTSGDFAFSGNAYNMADDSITTPGTFSTGVVGGTCFVTFQFPWNTLIYGFGAVARFTTSGTLRLARSTDNISFTDCGSTVNRGTAVNTSILMGSCTSTGFANYYRIAFAGMGAGACYPYQIYLFTQGPYDIAPEYETVRTYINYNSVEQSDTGIVYAKKYGDTRAVDELVYNHRNANGNAAIGLQRLISGPFAHRSFLVDANSMAGTLGLQLPPVFYQGSYYWIDSQKYPARFVDNEIGMKFNGFEDFSVNRPVKVMHEQWYGF